MVEISKCTSSSSYAQNHFSHSLSSILFSRGINHLLVCILDTSRQYRQTVCCFKHRLFTLLFLAGVLDTPKKYNFYFISNKKVCEILLWKKWNIYIYIYIVTEQINIQFNNNKCSIPLVNSVKTFAFRTLLLSTTNTLYSGN